MAHEDNFKSQYHKKPKRFNNKNDDEKCEAMALSMFDTVENAQNRFEFLRENMRVNAYKVLGTQIAKGEITSEDGVNGKINRYGHFNHHPYTDRKYEQRFVIIASLKYGKNN